MSSPLEEAIKIRMKYTGQNLLEEDPEFKPLQEAARIRNKYEALNQREQLAPEIRKNQRADVNYLTKMAVALGSGALNTFGRGVTAGSAYGAANVQKLQNTFQNKMNENLGNLLRASNIPEEAINDALPQTNTNELLDYLINADQNLKQAIDTGTRFYLGDDPDLFLRSIQGAGTTGGFRALSLLVNPILGGTMEAITNSGMNFSDNYSANKDRFDDALKSANYQMLTEAPMDIAIEYLENKFSPVSNPGESYLKNWLKSTGVNVISEAVQETGQEVIGAAGQNTYDNGEITLGNYLRNLGNESVNVFEHAKQVVPETTGSTLLTSLFTGLLGLAGGGNVQNRTNTNSNTNSELDFRTGENEDPQLKTMKEELAKIDSELPNITNPEIRQKHIIRRENLQNAINNFGKDAETVQSEGQTQAAINNAVQAAQEQAQNAAVVTTV